MGFFKHMIPGFNNAYKLKLYLAAYLLKLRQKFLSNLHKLPFMEPAIKADMNTYNGGQLPGITVEAVDLSKPQRFPYGGINVESKSVRGGLDRKQRTYVNPFEGHDLVAKNQEGNKLPIALDAKERYAGGERVVKSGKYFNDSISVRAVKSKSPWYKKPALILERILHSSVDPMFNDTTYAELPSRSFPIQGTIRAAGNDYYSGKKKRWQYPMFGDFFNFNNEKSTPEDKAEYDTLKRRFNTAWGVAKQQEGGTVERADNTRVASGRPQLVLSKIPYGAGKGPAGEGPMYLLNARVVSGPVITGEPTMLPGMGSRKLLSLGKPVKTVNGINYYKNSAGELKTAKEMALEMTNIGPKLAKKVDFKKQPQVPTDKKGIYNLVREHSYNTMKEDGYFDANGKWVDNNGINWDFVKPIFKPKYADDIDNAFLMEGFK